MFNEHVNSSKAMSTTSTHNRGLLIYLQQQSVYLLVTRHTNLCTKTSLSAVSSVKLFTILDMFTPLLLSIQGAAKKVAH